MLTTTVSVNSAVLVLVAVDEVEDEVVVFVVVIDDDPQLIVKLVPSGERAEGCASVAPGPATIVISCTEDPSEVIEPFTPPIVAEFVNETPVLSTPKCTVPKSASGRTELPEEGASVIHSAELLCAEPNT